MDKAILLSGGIDSIALAYWQKPKYGITINYGQKPASAEITASKAVCECLNIKHIIIEVDCSKLGSGDLSEENALQMAPSTEWWPFRNQLLVTLACMKVITLDVDEIITGSVLTDGFHKDGTEEFYNKISSLISYQEGKIIITAPAIELSSAELVLESKVPSNILFYAHSCHKSNRPCGSCRGCNKYINTIEELKNVGWF